MPGVTTPALLSASVADHPVYPTWVRPARIRLFWALTAAVVAVAVLVALVWPPGLVLAVLAGPFAYIALVITVASWRLGPRGADLQRTIHGLVAAEVGPDGRLLDVGCGSGELVIRLAKAAPGGYVGLDSWGEGWQYSKAQAERNAVLEGVTGLELVRGSASHLPFDASAFDRVVSCLTFREVRDVADRTVSLAEALRVLRPGGRFAFADLFDDPGFYAGRERVLEALRTAGGRVETVSAVSDVVPLTWPMTLGRVLGDAGLVAGTKAPAA